MCVGDERRYSIINSREGNTLADIALKASLIGKKAINYSYLKRGSDEVVLFSKCKFARLWFFKI